MISSNNWNGLTGCNKKAKNLKEDLNFTYKIQNVGNGIWFFRSVQAVEPREKYQSRQNEVFEIWKKGKPSGYAAP